MSLDEIIAEYMPSDDSIRDICEFFAVFAQDTRIRLVSLLSISPLAVGDIARLLRLNQTTVSHQLRILKDRRVVSTERRGKEIVYSLSGDGINDILLQAVKVTQARENTFAEKLENRAQAF